MARRVSPGVEVTGQPEFRELVGDGDVARRGHLVELVAETEAIVEYAHGDVEGLRECGITARQRHRERVVSIADHALLAPRLLPVLIHGIAPFVRDARGWRIAETIENQPQSRS